VSAGPAFLPDANSGSAENGGLSLRR
jgi:hypothetical protein